MAALGGSARGAGTAEASTRSAGLTELLSHSLVHRGDAPVDEHLRALGAVVEHLPDAVLITDAEVDPPGPRIRYANPAFERLSGYDATALIGTSPRALQTAHTAREDLDRIRTALERQEAVRAVLHNARPDGSTYWVEVDIAPVLDQHSTAVAFVAVQRDISEREEHARRHEALSTRLELSVETGQLGTWRLTLPDRGFSHNALYARLHGHADTRRLTLDEVEAATHPEDRGQVTRAWRRLLTDGVPLEQTYRIRTADGALRWVLERARLTDTHQGNGGASAVDGVTLDVTTRQQANEQVIETLDRVHDGYLAFDRQWRFVHCNATAEAMFGHTRDELRGRVLWEAYPELLGTDFERCYRQALRTGEPVVFQAHFAPWDRWYEERVHPSSEGVSVYFVDITQRHWLEQEQQRRREAEQQALTVSEQARADLQRAATQDDLTGLLSRRAMERDLATLLADPDRAPVLVFLDLDDFKRINDTLGHHLGDQLLQAAAARLEQHAPEDARVCRFAGDEFVVVLDHDPRSVPVAEIAERLRLALVEPYVVGEREVRLTASAGVAPALRGDDTATVLRNADLALAAAKQRGRDQIKWYDQTLHQVAVERLDLEEQLRRAQPDRELALRYQPIYALATGERVGAEALLRWHHPTRGLLSAGAFIQVGEQAGLLHDLSSWALRRAAADLAAARRRGQPLGTCWLNVAPEQLLEPTLCDELTGAMVDFGLAAGDLGIELTERTLVRDIEAVGAQLERVHARGVPIAVDDFGTGYASLALLQDLPLDVLKIDRSFIAQLDTDSGRAVAGAIVNLAHALGASASAEGVECPEQWHQLAALGCDTAAGFLLGRPQSLATGLPEAFAPRDGVAVRP